LRTLTLSAPKRLGGLFADVPTLVESGVDCKVGMWRGIIGAGGIPKDAVAFWDRTFAQATSSAEWEAELAKKYWANTFMAGAEERAFLEEERAVMTASLTDIGLLKS
jgi:putative tricarboxylic transport membrane protein